MSRPLRFFPLALAALVAALPPAVPAATILVDIDSDADVADAFCSLREAIIAANSNTAYHGCGAGAGADRVQFVLPPGSTILGSVAGLPTVTETLILDGSLSPGLTLDGAGLQPLLLIDSPAGGAGLQLEDLTLARGSAVLAFSRAGAVTVAAGDTGVFRRVVFRENFSEAGGGAVLLADATATFEDCFFELNEAGVFGGGALHAIRSVVTITRTTFFANETPAEPAAGQARGGGAILARDSELEIRRSTFSGNYSFGSGGAILAVSLDEVIPDSLTVTDTTIYENVGDGDGDDVGNVGGVAIAAFPGHVVTVVFQNDLIAANVDPGATQFPDVYVSGAGITTQGFNLVGVNQGMTSWFPAGLPNANGDYVGTAASPVGVSLTQLDYHGGLHAPVHLPQASPGNLAIDRGNCFEVAGDQRGFIDPSSGLRPVDDPQFPPSPGGNSCDIGAAELGAVGLAALPFADGFEDGTTGEWSLAVED